MDVSRPSATGSEATPTSWGGARPGAGAPKGNRNAAKRTIHEVVRDEALAV
ncbi:MAG: hypothetical protein IT299_04600 [Dehalococcoidia bacterium]|nr:hypothetical protein [Dehalococcoidia bacterium]